MKQPPRIARLAGTAWTSAAEVLGWRHFHVVGLRKGEGRWQVELAASCEAGKRVLVDARLLLEHEGWTPGWSRLPLNTLVSGSYSITHRTGLRAS